MDVFRAGSFAGRYLDVVAVEEPLQIRLDDRDVAVALRTPGNDEELTVGFLCDTEELRRPCSEATRSGTKGQRIL